MSSIALYLLKVVLCSGALYAYYYLALRNRVFHQYNRFFLLAAVLFSLAFPLIPLPTFYQNTGNQEAIPLYRLLVSSGSESVVVSTGSKPWNWQQIALVTYACIASVLLAKLATGLWQIRKLLHRSGVEQIGAVSFVPTDHSNAPFSFFRWLFWKKEIDLHSEGGQSIFRHELVHIREHHTIDKLLLQTILVLFWINPFFWFIRRELQLIHEFIADKKAVGQEGTEALAAMILHSVYGKQLNNLVNPFFQQPIKRRLAMLQKTLKQPRNAYLGRILTLPLCALLLFAFSKSSMDKPGGAPVHLNKTIKVIIDAGHGGEDAGASNNELKEKELTLELANAIKKINNNPNIQLVFTRSADAFAPLKDRAELAAKSGADLFISLHVGAINNDDVAANSQAGKGIEVIVSGKNEASRNKSILLGSALIQHLSTVYPTKPNLITREPGVWVLDANTVPAVLIECGYLTNLQDLVFITKKENQELLARKIISAIEAYATTKEPVTSVPVDTIPKKQNNADIKEVHVNTNNGVKTITIKYKNGKQETLTEKQAKERGLITPPPPPPPVPNSGTPPPPPPPPPMNENVLVVVDGKEIGTVGTTQKSGKMPKPEGISSINVLKDKTATDKYGDKGKYGVIEITTKKTSSSGPVFEKAEQPPTFPGGESAWREFLQKNMDAAVPIKKGAPAGVYTTMLQFKVGADGTISDLKSLTTHGHGMEEEVLKMMQQSPKWEPAVQNGQKVTALHKQPVTFVIAED